MTWPALPIALLAALAALCGAMALRDAVTWDGAYELITTLATTIEVAVDRILHGDPRGALRAF